MEGHVPGDSATMISRAERVEMHRNRIETGMANVAQRELKGMWAKNRPRRKRKHTPIGLLMARRIDRINMMARNPGWSL